MSAPLHAFHSSRRLSLPEEIAGSVIRYHPALWYQGRTTPGIVYLFRDIHTDEPRGIHRTFLTADGEKIDRKMFGPVKGAAIKLDADDEVTYGLTIGEGVETCLAARQLGFRPVWALGSADAIKVFPVLPGIEALTILAETDKTGANERAVAECARRWQAAGREVLVVASKTGGDINDAILG
jgi:putative DNA primase/helicase